MLTRCLPSKDYKESMNDKSKSALMTQVGFRKAMTTGRFLEEEPDKSDEVAHMRWDGPWLTKDTY